MYRKPARGLSVGWALIFVIWGLKQRCRGKLGFAGVNTGYERLINQHNRVWEDIIHPRNYHNFIGVHL